MLDKIRSSQYKNRADTWLFIAIVGYLVMNGAQLWETAIFIPAWTQAPPASLVFFKYGIDLKTFWIIVHSVHELALLLAVYFNWKIKARKLWLLLLVLIHAGIRAWTLAYFAPTIMELQQMEYNPTVAPDLVQKAARWKNLNYVRVAFFFAVNLGLIWLLFKHPYQKRNLQTK